MTELTLPYPPSINHYYVRTPKGGFCVGPEGMAYRRAVRVIVLAEKCPTIEGPLRLAIRLFPPDERRRDIDNPLKCLLDALEHGGAFPDDSAIRALLVRRESAEPPGRVLIQLEGDDPGPEQDAFDEEASMWPSALAVWRGDPPTAGSVCEPTVKLLVDQFATKCKWFGKRDYLWRWFRNALRHYKSDVLSRRIETLGAPGLPPWRLVQDLGPADDPEWWRRLK